MALRNCFGEILDDSLVEVTDGDEYRNEGGDDDNNKEEEEEEEEEEESDE